MNWFRILQKCAWNKALFWKNSVLTFYEMFFQNQIAIWVWKYPLEPTNFFWFRMTYLLLNHKKKKFGWAKNTIWFNRWYKIFHKFFFLFKKNFFLMFYFISDREREAECEIGRGRERGSNRTRSRLQAVSTEPDTGLEPTNREIMTWAEVGRSTDWATQAPQVLFFF